MKIETHAGQQNADGIRGASVAASPATKRPDPATFVTAVAVGLFALTVASVLTMHFAAVFNWQLH